MKEEETVTVSVADLEELLMLASWANAQYRHGEGTQEEASERELLERIAACLPQKEAEL